MFRHQGLNEDQRLVRIDVTGQEVDRDAQGKVPQRLRAAAVDPVR
jgi:hypothetical protein